MVVRADYTSQECILRSVDDSRRSGDERCGGVNVYIAHKRENGRVQMLKAHLEEVGNLAAEFAAPFGGERHAERIGLLHDLGKYSKAGQRRMTDPEHTAKVDHATAGGQVAGHLLNDVIAAFTVTGHHGGLMDMGSKADMEGATLMARMRKKLTGDFDPSAWKSEITLCTGRYVPEWLDLKNAYQVHFYTRMLFSCLVDADFLDTESFMQDAPPVRGGGDPMEELLGRLKDYIEPWMKDTDVEINKKRSVVLRSCLERAEVERGMYTLTVPTGGGKTVSSLAFALSHAVRFGLRRVIYVIPYTSIIEQNAAVFARILGEDNVLEHHSNVDFSEDEYDFTDQLGVRKRLAAENWDAPIVVTTAVQFFESLYAAKTSRCRKLHNLSDSVIIFDEAQMIPLSYLRPCVAAITELVRHYGVSAVLCTATQPALDNMIREFAPEMKIREICPEQREMVEFFRRVSFVWEGETPDEVLADQLGGVDQGLCIVNTRKRAQQLFELLPEEGRFHLSTMMTPEHRSRILCKIKKRLENHQICRVISTSLIEAGVDIDFPEVWREEAGLDSILQAAGRCNREGKRRREESRVHVFKAEGKTLRMIAQNVSAMQMAVDGTDEPDSPEIIRAYFATLHRLRNEQLDAAAILEKCGRLAFRSIAEAFQLIEGDTEAIYIPTEENAEMIELLRKGFASRGLLRKLGRYAVNVYRDHLKQLQSFGKIEDCGGFYILTDQSMYGETCGMSMEMDAGAALWI